MVEETELKFTPHREQRTGDHPYKLIIDNLNSNVFYRYKYGEFRKYSLGSVTNTLQNYIALKG